MTEEYQPGPDPWSGLGDADLEDDGVLDATDTLEGDPGDDPLDQAIVPPDRWSAAEGYGDTLAEERAGESLDHLLAQEEPDVDPYGDTGGKDDVAEPRAGRLVAPDEGAHPDAEADLVARDAGIDGGAASAEEAAVHLAGEGGEG